MRTNVWKAYDYNNLTARLWVELLQQGLPGLPLRQVKCRKMTHCCQMLYRDGTFNFGGYPLDCSTFFAQLIASTNYTLEREFGSKYFVNTPLGYVNTLLGIDILPA